MSSVNGETIKTMKKGEEISAPGFQLGLWLMGDYSDQNNPYYSYKGDAWSVNCEDLLCETDTKAQIEYLQSKGVKEIIFPEEEDEPEVRVSLVDYPNSVTFTRTS